MTISRYDERLKTLENKTVRLRVVCWLQLAVVCGLCFALLRQERVKATEGSRVLRAKGLIIEDNALCTTRTESGTKGLSVLVFARGEQKP